MREQKAAAIDWLQQTFAALMLACARGDIIDMRETLRAFPVQLTSVRDYAARLLSAASGV